MINHTIYVSNLNEKIKKPLLKKSLHRYEIADEMGAGHSSNVRIRGGEEARKGNHILCPVL